VYCKKYRKYVVMITITEMYITLDNNLKTLTRTSHVLTSTSHVLSRGDYPATCLPPHSLQALPQL